MRYQSSYCQQCHTIVLIFDYNTVVWSRQFETVSVCLVQISCEDIELIAGRFSNSLFEKRTKGKQAIVHQQVCFGNRTSCDTPLVSEWVEVDNTQGTIQLFQDSQLRIRPIDLGRSPLAMIEETLHWICKNLGLTR